MHYYAKLTLGVTYRFKGNTFARGVEVAVSKEVYDYLETVVEKLLVSEGNGFAVKSLPRFALRTEELTVQEQVAQEIEDAPDGLRPNKPGRKPAA